MSTPSRKDKTTRDSQTSRRRRYGADRHGEHRQDDAEAVKPDVTQLRHLREAYFGRASRHVPAKKARSRVASTRARSTTGPVARTSRTRDSQGSKIKPTPLPKRKERDRTAEYVYHSRASAARPERQTPSISRSLLSESAQPRRGSSPELPDEEVAPDDSISQVAARSSRRRRRKMPSTLRPIPEKSVAALSSAAKSKNDGGFWGSIFRQSSSTTAGPNAVDCLTCGTEVPAAKAAKLDCGHYWCHSCLKRIFKLAVQDPAHMPPKCCMPEPIPITQVAKLFDLPFKLRFNKKLDEYNTKNRIYCPNKRCGVWIRPTSFVKSGGRKHACCHKCGTKACIHCGQKLHRSLECPKDPEIMKLVEQAEQQGWKRCFNCNAMVELKEGCNHMTCRCLAEFCMVCGKKWKTCDCPWFNHSNVLPDDGLLPEPIEVVIRRVRAAYEEIFAAPAPDLPPIQQARRGYRAELNRRRRQEAEDQELARRMQAAAFD